MADELMHDKVSGKGAIALTYWVLGNSFLLKLSDMHSQLRCGKNLAKSSDCLNEGHCTI